METCCTYLVEGLKSLWLTWREMRRIINHVWHFRHQGLLPLHYLRFCTQIKPAATGIVLSFYFKCVLFPWCTVTLIFSTGRHHNRSLLCQMTGQATGLHGNMNCHINNTLNVTFPELLFPRRWFKLISRQNGSFGVPCDASDVLVFPDLNPHHYKILASIKRHIAVTLAPLLPM